MKHIKMILEALFKGSFALGVTVIGLSLIIAPLLTNAELKTLAVRGLLAIGFGLMFKSIQLILEKFHKGS